MSALAGGVWVWLGGTLLLLVRLFWPLVVGAELGTLLGPEETPVRGWFLWSASGLGRLMPRCSGWWRRGGWGVVVC